MMEVGDKVVKIGNCGWSYLKPKDFFDEVPEGSKLEKYSHLYELVETNSTFYRIPKTSTAEKWRKQADKVNPEFEFTVKVSKVITHNCKFLPRGDWAFERIKDVAKGMKSEVLLFQAPASFDPTEHNIDKLKDFFGRVDRERFKFAFEVRWADSWTEEIVNPLFQELELNQCIDPLRQDWFYAKDFAYFRLHGFGSPMYEYTFSDKELKKVAEFAKSLDVKKVYVLFNNATCYQDAKRFEQILREA